MSGEVPVSDEQPENAPKGRDLEEIRQILSLMRENDLSEFKLEDGSFRLSLKRRTAAEPAIPIAPQVAHALPATPPAAPAADPDEGLTDIPSPIVGTFYRASSPDTDVFASIGQEVDEDTVVCIIEAMKVMNEIKAEVRGIIRRVLVDNATPVQYGQPLFKVEPL